MLQNSGGITSTFWLSSREAADKAHCELDEVGYHLGHTVKAPSGRGLWLTVTHKPEELATVTSLVTAVDSSAVKE